MKLNKVIRVTSAALGEFPLKEDGATFKPSGMKRDTHVAEVAENIGYTETPQAATLDMTIQATLDASDINALQTDSLTIYLAGGGVHTMPNGWYDEPAELGKGEIKVKFTCGKSQKIQ